MSKPRLLFHAGGECLTRYGTLVRRTSIEEDVAETFTRSSTAYARDRTGKLIGHAANVPRVEWVTVGGVLVPGLLIERGAVNLFTQSDDLTHVDWTTGGLSAVTANQAVGPYGTITLEELVEDSGTSWHSIRQVKTITANGYVALSAFVTANGREAAQLALRDNGDILVNYCRAKFDLTNGTVTSTSAAGTGSVLHAYVEDWTDVAAGLYRIVLVGAVGNGATSCMGQLHVLPSVGGGESYTGDGASSIFAGAMQMEDGSRVATSYYPTTTAAATRNSEKLYGAFPHAPQDVTFYAKFIERDYGTSFQQDGSSMRVAQIGNASNGNPRLGLYKASATNDYGLVWNGGGSDITSVVDGGAAAWGDLVELAGVLSGGAVTLSISKNGGAVTSGATSASAGAYPAAFSAQRLHIGALDTGRGRGVFQAVKVASGAHSLADMRNA